MKQNNNSFKKDNNEEKCINNRFFSKIKQNKAIDNDSQNDFEFKKAFGQNFLQDKMLLNDIVEISKISCDDIVVEIGAGKGALTEFLSKKAKKVFSFEIDQELKSFLENKFLNSNVTFLFEDIMKVTDKKLKEIVGGKFFLVANLPYYITSPIITRFLQNDDLISMTIMVQDEVADRIVAKSKSKDYGVMSIFCQCLANAKKEIFVSRDKFFPVPKVDSAVVKLERFFDQKFDSFDEFISFVKRAFLMRRKKLSTNLVSDVFSKFDVERLLEINGFSTNVRAEELSIEEFKKLFAIFCKNNIVEE